ncbi:MAG: hypothetical protein RI909_2252 [Bacteroidota bacterium]|jgi:hypothetical protein
MKTFKRALPLLALGLLITLALMGVSITGAIFLHKKERDYDNEIIQTELVEAKDDVVEEKNKE